MQNIKPPFPRANLESHWLCKSSKVAQMCVLWHMEPVQVQVKKKYFFFRFTNLAVKRCKQSAAKRVNVRPCGGPATKQDFGSTKSRSAGSRSAKSSLKLRTHQSQISNADLPISRQQNVCRFLRNLHVKTKPPKQKTFADDWPHHDEQDTAAPNSTGPLQHEEKCGQWQVPATRACW